MSAEIMENEEALARAARLIDSGRNEDVHQVAFAIQRAARFGAAVICRRTPGCICLGDGLFGMPCPVHSDKGRL